MSDGAVREECAKPMPFRGSGPFLQIAPPLSLPLRHFALAAAAFLVFASGLLIGAPRLVDFGFQAYFALGLVHTLTLGWVAQTILGAWTQMIPVHGNTPLFSVRASKLGWWLFVVGAAAFVGALWTGSDKYWIPATLLYLGVLISLANLAVTHARAAQRDWTGLHFTAAFCWRAALGLVGVLMAVDRHRGTIFHDPEGGLIAHVHMALAGFVTTTIFGAGYRLFPWVSLHRLHSKWEGKLAFVLLQAATAGLALDCLFFGRRLMPLWACALAAAYLLYFAQMRPLLSSRPALEPSLAFVLLAIAGGALWVGLGTGMAFGWLVDDTNVRAAYIYAALVGFFTPVIFSQIHKIPPFLIWLHVYSPRQWTPPVKVPKIDDLSSRGLMWLEFFALLAAVPLGALGFYRESEALLRAAGTALLACAGIFAVNTALLLRHLARPDNRWTLPPTIPQEVQPASRG